MSETMKWAEDYYGLAPAERVSTEMRREAARELLRQCPLFEQFAGPGDGDLGADLLLDGMQKILEFTMATSRPAASTFHDRTAHMMWTVELVRAFIMQLEELKKLLMVTTSEQVAVGMAALPPERRKEAAGILADRAAAAFDRLFGKEAALN